MLKKIIIALFLSLFLIGSANALTVAWDAYTDDTATGLRIESSIDQSTWSTAVDNIPTTNVASDIPDGPDSTRVYYRMRAFDDATPQNVSDPSNVISYFWTTGGGGHEGIAPVDGIKLLDCDAILQDANHPDYNTCVNKHTLQ